MIYQKFWIALCFPRNKQKETPLNKGLMGVIAEGFESLH